MSFISRLFSFFFFFFDVCGFGEISIIHFYLQWIPIFVCKLCKTFVVLTGIKYCCGSGFRFKEAKDVVAYLILGLKVKQFLNLLLLLKWNFSFNSSYSKFVYGWRDSFWYSMYFYEINKLIKKNSSCAWGLLLLFALVGGIHISYFIIIKVFLLKVTCSMYFF
jgi:hypothetical protein